MSFLDALRHRIRTALRSDDADRERAEEYAAHQSLAQEQRAHDGASLDEARFAARREFGNARSKSSAVRGAYFWRAISPI